MKRAARIRQNQRRCRERKLAYVASLEERIRAYETNGVQANIHLQKLAKKLDLENRKLKRVLYDLCGIGEIEIDRADTETLAEEIKSRMCGDPHIAKRPRTTSRSSSFSGGIIETSADTFWSGSPSLSLSCGPFRTCCYPSAPLSDVRSQKPPTPPPSKDDPTKSAQDLLLTLAPRAQSATNCGKDLNPAGQRFCGLLQLLASEASTSKNNKTVPCRVSYELLKSLVDEQDAQAMENVAFELKDGVQMTEEGCRVDAKVLSKLLGQLTNIDNSSDGGLMTVDV